MLKRLNMHEKDKLFFSLIMKVRKNVFCSDFFFNPYLYTGVNI